MNIARYALYSGTMAGLASLAVLMLAAKVEGKALPQPINATSHWIHGENIHGENAGQVTRWNARHTATGLSPISRPPCSGRFPSRPGMSGSARVHSCTVSVVQRSFPPSPPSLATG